MDNKIYNVGDSIVITVKPKQKGTAILSGFTDSFIGLADEKKIIREFRIVEDEMFYTDWIELTQSTIQGKKIKQNNYIEVRYTRDGNDTSGDIKFQNIIFEGDFSAEVIDSPILDKSIFSNIAWDEKTESLAKNIFKKLYYRGIIPTYIQRGDNIDVDEDEDYIILFYTIAKFYAIIFRFFKRFENFYDDEELMLEWIRQNGISFDESTIELDQLKFLATHLYDEIRKRGTKMIFHRKDDVANGDSKELDGEFIRLIRSKQYDELIYDNIPLPYMGWCLGKSSPLYRGNMFSPNCNKTKENTADFQSLNNFVTFAQKSSSVSLEQIDGKQALLCKTVGAASCGLGRVSGDTETEVIDNLYPFDPQLDYEITFMFKPKLAGRDATINFGIEAFDASKKKILNGFIMPNNNATTEMFLNNISLEKFRTDTWYFVRGIIHAYSTDVTENVKLNIGFGNNLNFNNRFIKYGLPKIYISSTNSSSMYIHNYKIRPLVRGTNILPLRSGYENSHSLGFIQAPRIFYMYFHNNNNSQSQAEITDIIERYLLPFNMTDILQFINNE